jgi:hypothetical protein
LDVFIKVKKGDTLPWRFVLSDADGQVIDLLSDMVSFRMRRHEWDTEVLFEREGGKGGTVASDYITVSDTANGVVLILPTASDWADVSDCGTYVAEFKVSSDSGLVQFTPDIVVDVQEAIY